MTGFDDTPSYRSQTRSFQALSRWREVAAIRPRCPKADVTRAYRGDSVGTYPKLARSERCAPLSNTGADSIVVQMLQRPEMG